MNKTPIAKLKSNAAYAARNKDKVRAMHRTYEERHPERRKEQRDKRKAQKREYDKRYRERKKAELKEKKREYRENNREKINKYFSEYMKARPAYRRGRYAIRKQRLKQATPPWADLEGIKKIYIAAFYAGLTVDHKVPIRGRNVCGLHIPENLQLMTAEENRKKGNSHAS